MASFPLLPQFDGPAPYFAPLFHAAELAADDINLSVDPIFLGSVSEALVVLAAPAYGASLRNLHRACLVPTEDMRDNLTHVVASTLAARYSETQLVIVQIGFRGAHVVSLHVSRDIGWCDVDPGQFFAESGGDKNRDVLQVDHVLYIRDTMHLHGERKTPVSRLDEDSGTNRGIGCHYTL